MLPVLALDRLDLDELREACHDIGFFYVSGHGVDQELCARVLELSRRFFELPLEERESIDHIHSPQFRGYTRLADERTNGVRDQREQIDLGADREALDLAAGDPAYMRLQGPNLWPPALPELQGAVEPWLDQMGVLGHRLLRAIAASLGLDEDLFEPAFAELPHVHAKIIRYPGVDSAGGDQGVGAHKDYGFLSLLMLEPGSAGLQAEGPDGTWIDAPPVDGTFLVNLGEMLEVATDGYLRATVHRVVSPPAGSDRISVPYFFNPRLDATVERVRLPPELAAEAEGAAADDTLSETYGVNALRGWVRAHPEVAARHYPSE
ncbi:MAG TPA: 2-oxoglutarate and iron-dependent oxygenase domain-containing protein [Thermoleophilaceae bacterium]|nr:2-oxoglutarate and iron-dependent oxygenase domain-containing protein [Thermoleophilaceae bacterium]